MYPHTDQVHMPVQDLSLGINLFWLIEDFTDANGGTRILPGSHKPGIRMENLFSIEETIPVEAPAGSLFIFDLRLWHATGANKTERNRPVIISHFVRSWVRSIDNGTISVSDEALAMMSDRVKTMFGFRITDARGTIEGQPQDREGTLIDRNYQRIPALKPRRLQG
jgi:ectoine hydroxylase-related dioxygenase (phytanoyl-CoA dioxygenase family)